MDTGFARRITYLTLMGAAALVVAWVLGVALNLSLGPAFGGILNAFATAFVVGVAVVGVKKWYSPVVVWLVFSVLAWPTITMGPPGPHKILIGLATGLLVALLLAMPIFRTKHSWIKYFIAGAAMSAFMTYLILLAMLYLNLSPESAAKLKDALPFLLPLYAGLGGAGFAVAYRVFENKLSRLSYFSNL
ncbi:MAG TPA: hypothetical protein VEW26_09505 [Allosphingosinicella sp.]|nr:hypothetical protein [Allosphingosinicella sp.]